MSTPPCVCHVQPSLGAALAQAVAATQFGTIELVIHDGQVVQLERHERIRLQPATARSTRTAGRATHISAAAEPPTGQAPSVRTHAP